MIPRTWIIIAAGVMLLGSNVVTGCAVNRYVTAQWEEERNQAANDALKEKARLDAQYRAREAAQAENTRDLETEYNAELAKVRVGGAHAERSYADSLRTLSNRLGQCQSTGEALSAIVAADGAREREDRLRDEIGRDFKEVGERANELAATVRLCVKWASSVGR